MQCKSLGPNCVGSALQYLNPFQLSVAFHIETNHLIYSVIVWLSFVCQEGSFFYYVREIFRKIHISYPLSRARFSENV